MFREKDINRGVGMQGDEILSGQSRSLLKRDGTVWGLNNHNGTILLGKWGPGGRA